MCLKLISCFSFFLLLFRLSLPSCKGLLRSHPKVGCLHNGDHTGRVKHLRACLWDLDIHGGGGGGGACVWRLSLVLLILEPSVWSMTLAKLLWLAVSLLPHVSLMRDEAIISCALFFYPYPTTPHPTIHIQAFLRFRHQPAGLSVGLFLSANLVSG